MDKKLSKQLTSCGPLVLNLDHVIVKKKRRKKYLVCPYTLAPLLRCAVTHILYMEAKPFCPMVLCPVCRNLCISLWLLLSLSVPMYVQRVHCL